MEVNEPMKCLRDKDRQMVVRVADEVAFSMVKRNLERFSFCPKSEWKAQRKSQEAAKPEPTVTVKTEEVVTVSKPKTPKRGPSKERRHVHDRQKRKQ